jgi:hypothetical protein
VQGSNALVGQLGGIAFLVVILSLVMWRRMRPQIVVARRIAISGVIICLVVVASLAATGGALVRDPAALALAPVFLVVGAGVGVLLVRTMRFWTDPNTGALWMRGGPLFAVILVVTLGVRFGVRMAFTGSMFGSEPGGAALHHGFWYDLTADLLFLSLGMWVARAVLLVRRVQQPAPTTP